LGDDKEASEAAADKQAANHDDRDTVVEPNLAQAEGEDELGHEQRLHDGQRAEIERTGREQQGADEKAPRGARAAGGSGTTPP